MFKTETVLTVSENYKKKKDKWWMEAEEIYIHLYDWIWFSWRVWPWI